MEDQPTHEWLTKTSSRAPDDAQGQQIFHDVSHFALSHQNVYKTEYQFGLLEEIIQYIENKELFEIPAIGVYYYGYLTLSKNENAEYFLIINSKISCIWRYFCETKTIKNGSHWSTHVRYKVMTKFPLKVK